MIIIKPSHYVFPMANDEYAACRYLDWSTLDFSALSGIASPHSAPEQPGVARTVESPTALHYAAHDGDVTELRALLREGADPNATTYFGFSPLHLTVREYARRQRNFFPADRWAECARLLLEAGANPLLRCFPNTTAAGVGDGCVPPALRDAMVVLAEWRVWWRDDERGFDEVSMLAKRAKRATARLAVHRNDDEQADAPGLKSERPGERSAPRHRVSAGVLDAMAEIARTMEDDEERDRSAPVPEHTRLGWWTGRPKTSRQRTTYREIRSTRAATA